MRENYIAKRGEKDWRNRQKRRNDGKVNEKKQERKNFELKAKESDEGNRNKDGKREKRLGKKE
jgi:hypothetical protein